MKEYAFLAGVALAACGGAKTGAKTDTPPHDSAAVAGPPAVTATPPTDSIASRSRDNPAGRKNTDLKTPPSAGKTNATIAPQNVKPVPPQTAGADTTRGVVSVVGTSRDQRVMIAPGGGGRRIEITGPLAALIGHVAGADIWVSGTRTGTSMEASRFVVRTVDGAPAIDGTLKTEASGLFIVTSDGTRTRIAVPPPALMTRDGARVWITGDPSKAVSSYGFIDPPR
jgi:hypothetical protein